MKNLATCLAAAAAALGISLDAAAQPGVTDAYATSPAAGGEIWKNPFGLCWRTSMWTREKAIAECDPDLVQRPAPRAAPAATAPVPAQAPAPAPVPAPAPAPVARVLDSDGDGVPDDQDRCPGTRSGAKVDASGCEIPEVLVLKGVTFATGSSRLAGNSTSILDEAAAALIKRGDVNTEVAGHTDNRGSPDRNRVLSQQRAESVMRYLVSKGVSSANLTARGYGQDNPVADNGSESGRAANRRVELRVAR